MKAVFLDRDGVLTVEKGYVRSVDELEIFPYANKCVKTIHEKGYLAIVVTNQSGVARGYFSENQIKEMNKFLIEKTGVDTVYYCPHYRKGIVPEYAVRCGCRKPLTGMIEQACREFDIEDEELRASYMVGDRAGDIWLGRRMGIATVLLESGYGTAGLERKAPADFVLEDLREFVAML